MVESRSDRADNPTMAPTPRARPAWSIQAAAVAALAWGAAYLTWRIGWTWRDADPVLYAFLLAAEVVGFVNLAFFVFLAWRVPDCGPRPATVHRGVDVLVPTYDEPVEVLRATLLGCAAVRHPHTTWLLDDGRRPEMAALADELGARYLTRPNNDHAKAGNINHALSHLDSELVAVLDADHVPLPDFLDHLCGHFDDPEVVLVQAPHEFYNLDSVQHVDGEVHEQSLFFRVVCPRKDEDNSVFWCGSGTVIRRQALMDVGGVATRTIAEDFHTTIKLHQRGWRTRYVNETLLLGLAPHDLSAFLLQRSRWARGNLRVFLTGQNPVFARGLTPSQRLSYLGSLSHYFGGPQRLVLLSVLIATLFTGLLPLRGDLRLFALLWAPWVVLSLLATKLLGRGHVGPVSATAFGWMTMGIYTTAAISLLVPSFGRFKVTPKGGTDQAGLRVLGFLRLLTVGGTALACAVVARALEVVGVIDLPPLPGFATVATLGIGVFELVVIGLVLRFLARHRQRRDAFRFPVELTARTDGHIHRVVDLNTHGAGVLLGPGHAVGDTVLMTMNLPGLDGDTHPVTVAGLVRSFRAGPEPGTFRAGIEFTRVTTDAAHRIMEYCHVLAPAQRAGARLGSEVTPAPTALPGVRAAS
jgi:cellulose synthase (UDP-forming)